MARLLLTHGATSDAKTLVVIALQAVIVVCSACTHRADSD